MSTATGDCTHPARPPETADGATVCQSCGKNIAAETIPVIITPEQEKFARAIIGHQQQIILKSKRIIDDTRRQFGLKD